MADIRGLDFSSYKSTWSVESMGLAKYKNYLSNARLQQSYRMTSGGVEYLDMNTRFDAQKAKMMEQAVIQFYQVKGIADNKVIDLKDGMKAIRCIGKEYKKLKRKVLDTWLL